MGIGQVTSGSVHVVSELPGVACGLDDNIALHYVEEYREKVDV
jgi:hypothetical protein